MKRPIPRAITIIGAALAAGACAGWDNPTALADLEADVEFEVAANRVETMEEVEIHVHAMHDGAPMIMREPQLEIEHADGGPVRLVDLQPEGDGYAAHVMFFEEGEHHLHFMGRPAGHRMRVEMGEHEVHAHNQHRVIGAYWVELVVSPAPVFADSSAHVHVLVYDLLSDGTAGARVGGLEMEMAIHAPDGDEHALTAVEEEPGAYEAAFTFEHEGLYELHVEIHVDPDHFDGEFHIPVFSPDTSTGEGDGGEGGHPHG